MPGGATLVATMKQHGATCALVSGGFTYFTAMVQHGAGLRFRRGQRAEARRHARWPARSSCRSWARKPSSPRSIASAVERGLHVGETITVGDGANDLPMLKAAGLGVAFHAKPVVAAEVAARIDHGDLTALLYLQGYRQSDFIERPDPHDRRHPDRPRQAPDGRRHRRLLPRGEGRRCRRWPTARSWCASASCRSIPTCGRA